MSFTEKVTVLDLLINVLTEHEEKLDELVTRLETVCEKIGDAQNPHPEDRPETYDDVHKLDEENDIQ